MVATVDPGNLGFEGLLQVIQVIFCVSRIEIERTSADVQIKVVPLDDIPC